MPYHALTHAERDTYNARRKLLAHMGDILRGAAVKRERERLDHEAMSGLRSKSFSLKNSLVFKHFTVRVNYIPVQEPGSTVTQPALPQIHTQTPNTPIFTLSVPISQKSTRHILTNLKLCLPSNQVQVPVRVSYTPVQEPESTVTRPALLRIRTQNPDRWRSVPRRRITKDERSPWLTGRMRRGL